MTLQLSDADRGRTLEITAGAFLEIALPENPTTGYRWRCDVSGQGIVEQTDSQFQQGGSPAPGAAGTRILRLRAQGPGEARIRLMYWQEWSGEASKKDDFEIIARVTG